MDTVSFTIVLVVGFHHVPEAFTPYTSQLNTTTSAHAVNLAVARRMSGLQVVE